MNVDKLTVLRDLLRIDADDETGISFDMSVVVRLKSGPGLSDVDWTPSRSCGTAGCAIGLAAVSEEFPELQPASGLDVWLNDELMPWNLAAERLFDVDRYVVHRLFDPMSYGNSPRGREAELEVASRIDRLLQGGCP